MSELSIAYFGGGCFWCTEAVFQRLKGVEEIVSGYMGGAIKNPSYKEICTGTTGHAEIIKIVYDANVISFEALLNVFWTSHDPTTLNRQGNDKGTQYRSVIFYNTEEEKNIAAVSRSEVAPTVWSDPIVTEISEAQSFYAAEKEHQNFYNQNGFHGYCRVVISPKIAKLRANHAHLLKAE